MVDPSTLAVAGTLLGSAVTGGATLIGVKLRQNAETRRRKGEIFLQKRADALIELQEALANCENNCDELKVQQQNQGMATIFDTSEEEARESLAQFFTKSDRADIFLSEQQSQILNQGARGLTSLFLEFSEGEYAEYQRQLSEEDARKAIDEARQMLRDEIDEPARF